jgi:hypothetical protein
MKPPHLPLSMARVMDAQQPPHLFILSGHPGCGKTHLLASIFLELVQQPLVRSYWPEDVHHAELMRDLNAGTKRIHHSMQPPLLWWGVRMRDPMMRNASLGSAFEAQADALDALLANHQRQQRMHQRLRHAGQATIEGIAAITQLSALNSTIQLLRSGGALKRIRSAGEPPQMKGSGESLLQRVASGVASICLADRKQRRPFVLAIDDLHHLTVDTLSREFLQELWARAVSEGWPLTILATSNNAADVGLGSAAEQVTQIELMGPSREELRALLVKELPGLTAAQQSTLLDRTFASPGSLQELVAQLRLHLRLFVERNPQNALMPNAEAKIASIETTAERHWAQRWSPADATTSSVAARLAAQGALVSCAKALEAGRLLGGVHQTDPVILRSAAKSIGVRFGEGDQGSFISGAALMAARRHLERHADAARLHVAVRAVDSRMGTKSHE